jgi:3'(2'), 5'-bisphosphate nucleotidase
MLYEQERQVATKAVIAAAHLCEQVRREQGSLAIAKPDNSPVTVGDFGAQAVICQALAQAFPQDSMIGEESSLLLRSPDMSEQLARVTHYVQTQIPDATPETVMSWIDAGNGEAAPRYWTLDPIDGTKGYLRGDQYAIALALVEEGEVKLGLLGCPALPFDLSQPQAERGVLFVAVRGQGASMIPLDGGEPRPIHVSDASPESMRRLARSVVSEHSNPTSQDIVAELVGLTDDPLCLDSQAKYGVVARGEAALYIRLPFPLTSEKRQNTWDHAAGAIVVEEAGGRVTDMQGQPLDFSFGAKLLNNRGIIASNGIIHDAVIAAVAQQIEV